MVSRKLKRIRRSFRWDNGCARGSDVILQCSDVATSFSYVCVKTQCLRAPFVLCGTGFYFVACSPTPGNISAFRHHVNLATSSWLFPSDEWCRAVMARPRRTNSNVGRQETRFATRFPSLQLSCEITEVLYDPGLARRLCVKNNVTAMWELWNYEISGYHSNQLLSVNTLLERKLCSRPQTKEQSVAWLYRANSASIDNVWREYVVGHKQRSSLLLDCIVPVLRVLMFWREYVVGHKRRSRLLLDCIVPIRWVLIMFWCEYMNTVDYISYIFIKA
jgi:hypothetical protein